MASEGDSEFYEITRELVEEIADWLQTTEIPEVEVQRVYPASHGPVFEHHSTTKKHLQLLFRARSEARRNGDPVPGAKKEEEFTEYIESQGHSIASSTTPFFLSIFGEQGEFLDSYEGRFEKEFRKLERTLETGQVSYTVKTFLRGIELEEGPVDIGDIGTLREPTDTELTFDIERFHQLLPNMMPEVPVSEIIESVVLEMGVKSPVGIGAPEGQIRQDVFIPAASLFDVGNVKRIRTHFNPENFLGVASRSATNSGIESKLPETTISPDDGDKLRRLFELLRTNYDSESRDFEYPLSAAIDHYQTAISKRTYTRESVTFAIIGMEALYGGRKGKVTAYCPLLLGSASNAFDPATVREQLTAGYNEYRNQWAHGGRRKRGGKPVQAAVLDYLRSSIVVFLCLTSPNQLTKSSRNEIVDLVERATIDENARSELLSRVDDVAPERFLRSVGNVEMP